MHGYKWPINCTRTRTAAFEALLGAAIPSFTAYAENMYAQNPFASTMPSIVPTLQPKDDESGSAKAAEEDILISSLLGAGGDDSDSDAEEAAAATGAFPYNP